MKPLFITIITLLLSVGQFSTSKASELDKFVLDLITERAATDTTNQPSLVELDTEHPYGSIYFTTQISGDLYIGEMLIGSIKADQIYSIQQVPVGWNEVSVDGEESWQKAVQVEANKQVQFDIETEEFFVVVEKMPELKGGMAKLQESIKYPDSARRAGIQGRVTVQFIVNEEGKVENAKVVRGIGGGCDEEALKAVQKAEFYPGYQRGEPVRVQYSLSLTFRLGDK